MARLRKTSSLTSAGEGAVARARWAGDVTGDPVSPPEDRGRVDRTASIRKLVRDNPKQGASAQRFALYRDGTTVSAYVEAVQRAGFSETTALDDVLWDVSRGFITLEPASGAVWTVPDAKAKLSEILRLAREGKPQAIGAQDPCIVVSATDFERWRPRRHLGRFLLETAPRGAEIELPSRADHRGDPFADE
jgi:hypothetical protein